MTAKPASRSKSADPGFKAMLKRRKALRVKAAKKRKRVKCCG